MNEVLYFLRIHLPRNFVPCIDSLKFDNSSTSLAFQKSKSASDVVGITRPNKVVEVANTESALIISNGINQEMSVPSPDKVPAYWIEF